MWFGIFTVIKLKLVGRYSLQPGRDPWWCQDNLAWGLNSSDLFINNGLIFFKSGLIMLWISCVVENRQCSHKLIPSFFQTVSCAGSVSTLQSECISSVLSDFSVSAMYISNCEWSAIIEYLYSCRHVALCDETFEQGYKLVFALEFGEHGKPFSADRMRYITYKTDISFGKIWM